MTMISRTGTAAELGIDGRTLGCMARRGQAEVIGETRGRRQMVNIWRVYDQQLPPTVQAHLRQMRLEADVTIKDLADRACVAPATINYYELYNSRPRTMTIYSVLDVLGFRFAELTARIYGKPVPERMALNQTIPLHDAVMAAFAQLAPGYRLPKQVKDEGYNVHYSRINNFCAEAAIDPVDFWRHADSWLRWTR